MYAGVVCRKCYKGCNHDTKIKFLKNTYENLEKRFGGYVCSDCVTEIVGGKNEVKKLQSKKILSEMGL